MSDAAYSMHVGSEEGEISLYLYGHEMLPGNAHRKYAWLNVSEEGAAILLSDRSSEEQPRVLEIETAVDLKVALEAAMTFLKPE